MFIFRHPVRPILLSLFLSGNYCMLSAQSAASNVSTAGLQSIRLLPHADLLQNQRPGRNLRSALVDAKIVAASRRIPWKGLTLVVHEGPLGTDAISTFSPENLYASLTCQADAIVSGYVTDQASHLTASASGVYSDYSFVPDKIFHSVLPLDVNRPIIVTGPGGQIVLQEGEISLDHRQYPRFDRDRRYLLFLRSIPSTGAFQAVDAWSSIFTKGDGKWVIARTMYSTALLPFGSLDSTNALVNQWAANCINRDGKK